MDFSFSDDEQAVAELAKQILGDLAAHDRVRKVERAGGARFDRELWKAMAEAGLSGIAVPESYGGAGLGFLEVALIVEQIGRRAAPVPFLECAVLAGLPLAEFGTEDQKQRWLPKLAAGEAVLTAALVEETADASSIATSATRDNDGFRLDGRKICVPYGQLADCVLVPANETAGEPGRLGEPGVFLVDPSAEGCRLEELDTTSGQPEAILELSGVRVALGDRLPGSGREIVEWISERANAALCWLALGACEESLALTAEYSRTRKQFGMPIAQFQAVGHRQADAYIDTEAIRLTAWQAASRIADGLPASTEVALAKFWAAEAGARVVHAAQHLHGGVGVDRDYPLHRYFLYAKQLELTLGGGTEQLLKIGRHLAELPA
jgi:alkylation response protein AidB-like acyl-CoA dehydrogenase